MMLFGLIMSYARVYISQIKSAHLDNGLHWEVDMTLANR